MGGPAMIEGGGLGAMGLEDAVRLGYKKELAAAPWKA